MADDPFTFTTFTSTASTRRKSIGAIFQDFARYDLSISENIGLGNVSRLEILDLAFPVLQRALRIDL